MHTFVELLLSGLLLLIIVQGVKWSPQRSSPSVSDGIALAAGAGALALLSSLDEWLIGLVALAVALWWSALWLDALLWRLFTIELGPGGIGGVVFSSMAREIGGLSAARVFFRENRLFLGLPVVALLIGIAPAVDPVGARLLVDVAVLAYLIVALARTRRPASRELPRRRSAIRSFVSARPLPLRRDLVPRPEDSRFLEIAPVTPAPSPRSGLLFGQDIVLLTFESLGCDHLDAYSPGGARTPFLEALLGRGVRSKVHFSPSPTTNHAHLALYASGYREPSTSGVSMLADLGYRTAYLSTISTAHFGLRGLLDRAAFRHVIDASVLGRSRGDYGLINEGVEALRRVEGDGPLFLHVHATQTHVPYQVWDRARFSRFPEQEDLGRFLNGIEETDFIFSELIRALTDRSVVRDPLIVVSSDHGQSFGRMGYWSHGSAIVREQVNVPCVFHHPRLDASEVPFSSHFDVLPTILDLVGAEPARPVFGRSVFSDPAELALVLWAGHPSRATTSNFGLVATPGTKYMLDLAREECTRMDWRDEGACALEGSEREYVSALLAAAFRRLELT